MRLARAYTVALLLLLAGQGSAMAQASAVPAQDNELLFGAGTGALLLREQPEDGPRYHTIGFQLEAYLGLLERATSWLDAELVLGFCALGSGPGLSQLNRGRRELRSFLPGAFGRGWLRAVFEQTGGFSLGLGLEVQLVAAPAVGSAMRVLPQASLGWELWRSARSRVGLDLVYSYALFDGLVAPSTELLDGTQGLGLRLGYSF